MWETAGVCVSERLGGKGIFFGGANIAVWAGTSGKMGIGEMIEGGGGVGGVLVVS